jgi:hypothetical protein
MKIPIENKDFIDIEHECPEEMRNFLHQINNYRKKWRRCLNNYRYNQNLDVMYKTALEILSSLETILWRFVSIINEYSEKNGKDLDVTNQLENDFINYMGYISPAIGNFSELPLERRNLNSFKYVCQKLGTVFNSLLGPCLLDAWIQSRKPITSSLNPDTNLPFNTGGSNFYCDKKIFYEELFNSVSRYTGHFRRELFIMAPRGGNLQTAYLPYLQGNQQRPLPAEKLKPKVVIPDDEVAEINDKDIDSEDEL